MLRPVSYTHLDVYKRQALLDGRPAGVQYERISYITGEGSYYPALTVAAYGQLLTDLHPAFDLSLIHISKDFEYSFKRLAAPDTAAPYAETVVGMIDGYEDAVGNPDAVGNRTTEPDFDALNVVASEDGKTLPVTLSYPCAYFDKLAADVYKRQTCALVCSQCRAPYR